MTQNFDPTQQTPYFGVRVWVIYELRSHWRPEWSPTVRRGKTRYRDICRSVQGLQVPVPEGRLCTTEPA